MVKGLSESGSQRVSIIGSDMLLQLEWSIEAMSKLKSRASFSQWQIDAAGGIEERVLAEGGVELAAAALLPAS
jgi:hypothetical protein